MRVSTIPSLCLLLSLLVVGSPAPSGAAGPDDWPDVVARVEGYEITRDELAVQAEIVRAGLVREGRPDPAGDPTFYRQVLEGLIGEMLVYAGAQELEMKLDPAEVDAVVAEMEARFSDADAFDAALEAQGTDRQELREQIERTKTIEMVIEDQVRSRLELPDDAALRFYQDNREALRVPERRRVRHILIRPGDGGLEAARARAAELRGMAASGGDFAALAREHSDDAATAENGGILGWVEAGAASGELAKAALSMDPEAGPRVVETREGVHVLDVMQVTPSRIPAFEEVAVRLQERLLEMAVQEEVQRWTSARREAADIEVFID